MEDKKAIKVSLGTVICMFIILILIFALIAVYYFGFVANKDIVDNPNNNISDTTLNNSNENISANISSNSTIEFKPSKYAIQFNADLLGEEFEQAGNEIKGCDYEISFLENNKFIAYMNFGNSIEGTYSVSDDNKINCILTSASGEYSPKQKINEKISFKINSDSEIEIIEVPEFYTIKTSKTTESGEVLTDETKEMGFWPLVEGIKFISVR